MSQHLFPRHGRARRGSPGPSPSATTGSPSPSPTLTGSPGTCALTASIVNSWPGGYQVQFTVANNGTAPGTGWGAGFSFGDSAETIASSWSATVSQSGQKVSALNASYDGAIPAGGSVTWGMVVNGGNQVLSGLSCTVS